MTTTPNPQYLYRPADRVSFEEGCDALRRQGRQVIPFPVDITRPATIDGIKHLGRKAGLTFNDFTIDLEAFAAYVEAAGYTREYAGYYVGNQKEKSLEHFIALTLLQPKPGEVFVDLASEHSPVAEIYGRLTGVASYSQDIMYEAGIHDGRIGGDACAMPVPDGFISSAALTCSLEHFEQDGDRRLFSELARALRPGGAVCVVPFYLNVAHVVQTDPSVSVPANVPFDPDAVVYCTKGWENRHARFYSPQTFVDRIIEPARDHFAFDLYYLTNAAAIDTIYARFAFVATRR